MDLLDAELGNRHGPLAVNKASGKIAKGLRRPVVAQPRPAPTVYKIEAGHFRSLVQELTGTSPSDSASPSPPPKPPSSSGNSRLQKIAPPPLSPLRPIFSYPKLGAAQQYPPQQYSNPMPSLPSPTNSGQMFNSQIFNNGVPYNAGPLSPSIVRKYSNTPLMALLSPHAFSPVPSLTASDQMWANALESPTSIAMRHLAQSLNSTTNENLSNGFRHTGQTVNSESLQNGVRHSVQTTSVATLNENAMLHTVQPMNTAFNENQAMMRSYTHNMNDCQGMLQSAHTMVTSANETVALRQFAHSMASTTNEVMQAPLEGSLPDSNNNNGAGRAQTVFSSTFSLSPRSLQSISALGQHYH